jgi:hypothetical protein
MLENLKDLLQAFEDMPHPSISQAGGYEPRYLLVSRILEPEHVLQGIRMNELPPVVRPVHLFKPLMQLSVGKKRHNDIFYNNPSFLSRYKHTGRVG